MEGKERTIAWALRMVLMRYACCDNRAKDSKERHCLSFHLVIYKSKTVDSVMGA